MGEHNEAYIKASVLITGVIMWKLLLLLAKINYFYLKFFSLSRSLVPIGFSTIQDAAESTVTASERRKTQETRRERKKKVRLLLDSCRF